MADSHPRSRAKAPTTVLRRAWPRIKQVAVFAFAIGVLGLIAWRAREIDWNEVLGAVSELPLQTLAFATLAAVIGHLAYYSYDLLARRYTGHRLSTVKTVAVAGVSFAFNLNFGSLIGGMAMRFRLYGRFGLVPSMVTRIVAFCLVTNWMGYAALGGLAFASGFVELPDDAPISSTALRFIGVAMIAVALGYLAASRWSSRRSWTIRGHCIELPRARMALLQIGVSCLHWSAISAAVYLLLQGKVGFITVLGALLVASIAGVVTHIPAGLGVLEAVFLSLLSGAHAPSALLAALLAYRAIFYLMPLLIAGVVYLTLELSQGRKRSKLRRQRSPGDEAAVQT